VQGVDLLRRGKQPLKNKGTIACSTEKGKWKAEIETSVAPKVTEASA